MSDVCRAVTKGEVHNLAAGGWFNEKRMGAGAGGWTSALAMMTREEERRRTRTNSQFRNRAA